MQVNKIHETEIKLAPAAVGGTIHP